MKQLALASLTVLLLVANGCVIEVDDDGHYDDEGHHDDDGGGSTNTDPYLAIIDRGETLTTELGEGAGVFVEYAGDGNWTIWTSCDTALSGVTCLYDVYISSQSDIDTAEGEDLEGEDYAEYTGNSALYFGPTTSIDRDALHFHTTPGDLIQVDVFLDGYEAPSYLVWFGEGAVQSGAPYMPVIFNPNGA